LNLNARSQRTIALSLLSSVGLAILTLSCGSRAPRGTSVTDTDQSTGGSDGYIQRSADDLGWLLDGQGGGGTAGTSVGGASGATGASEPERCGAQACANYQGEHSFVETSFTGPGAPPDAAALFATASLQAPGSSPASEPAIVYPSNETMFPINVSRIRHEWTPGSANDSFRLRFEGVHTTVTVYTRDTSWTPSEEQWDWIAESNRGGSLTFTVSALAAGNPAQVWQSQPVTLLFSDAAVEGAIYYWSTGTQGIMKALVSDPIPTKFYPDPAAPNANTCGACHTLSRDGKRLAVGYGGEKLWEVSVPERERIVPSSPGGERASSWTTFSPDGKMLLVAAAGKLTLIDSDTGAPIGANAGLVPIPSGKVATHPDWSALGDHVAITLGTRGGGKEVEGGSIAILPYDNGAWGTPDIIVPSTGASDNNFFPAWSPDSKWLVYVNAAAKSKDAVSASLRLISVTERQSIVLTRLNQRVNNADGVQLLGNSMPTWAPSTKPGTFWLAFSSLRPYASLRPLDAKEDQIWIAAVDPGSSDPSYAAFWAPFQSIEAGNHRAFWTHTGEDQQCSCVERCGDNLDNDCNGTADEASCTTCLDHEICGDGIDNNCDCVIDNCPSEEICDDGIDNDGDGFADTDDAACFVIIR